LTAGVDQEFRIELTEADSRVDAVLMRPEGAPIEVGLIGPETAASVTEDGGATERHGTRVSQYSLALPYREPRGRKLHAGTWRVRVTADTRELTRFFAALEARGCDVASFRRHGLRYLLQVRVRSHLRLQARLNQTGFTPGSTLLLQAVLTQSGLPLDGHAARVRVQVAGPGGLQQVVRLGRRGAGVYEGELLVQQAGVYRCRVIAEGRSRRGARFRREQLLTGAIVYPRAAGVGHLMATPSSEPRPRDA
jgi:hypothetical protein